MIDTKEFEKRLSNVAMNAMLKIANEGFVLPYENKYKIPASLMEEVWKMVDIEKIKEEMARNIEKQLADKITNSIAQEISTDIKQILSVKENREAIRAEARTIIKKLK